MRSVLLAVTLLAPAAPDDPHRPVYHFTPARNWMNDPNGLVYYRGEYHLFFQHNPFGNKWGHMSWGHAVSRDLLHWEELRVALPEENGIMIFSGSAVVDEGNTSGFCKGSDCLVAIYTGHTKDRQHQNIAYSNDRGRTWTKYTGNPVLDLGMKDFRDPKVIRHGKSWIMVAALPVEKKVRFFRSSDLKKWEPLSDFGPAGATAGIWECPDLFALDGKWVLVVNLNPGGIAGGSGGQYFVGRFDGSKFTADNEEPLWIDYGRDMYATVSFFGTSGRRVWMGWMSNWQYAGEEPTTTWRTAQSLPRELRIRNGRIVQEPVRELRRVREPASLQGFRGDAYEIEALIDLNGASEAGFLVRKGAKEQTRVGLREGEFFIDRTQSGNTAFHKTFPGVHSAPFPARRLRIFVDRSSVEVFGDGITITDRIFPGPASLGLETYSRGGEAKFTSVKLWRLR
jgi:fructan beta-fructosidase